MNSCGAIIIKYSCYLYNLLFSLCGLALLIFGAIMHVNFKDSSGIDTIYSFLAIGIIIIGGITFIIALFGCIVAIWENRSMIITFGIFVWIILVIQIALSVYLFVVLNKANHTDIEYEYKKIFDNYWENRHSQVVVDLIQTDLHCCGVDGPDDYNVMSNTTEKYPWSCCEFRKYSKFEFCESNEVHHVGCRNFVYNEVMPAGKILGGVILIIAAVEFIGITLAFSLAYVISKDKRRAMEA
ncbi:hypothetical protein PV327_010219 [Microctonus hyperodae]|uniref:Tetraspanin n=1 Tax=Microctonus hyperodae TaxID=165561 RepID=A0AA39FRF2_MICHY|nr:hypothetical protein PV327_010219 [Microctonus hyperodae]